LIEVPIRPPIFDFNVLALHKSLLIQAMLKPGNEIRERGSSLTVQESNDGNRRLLRMGRKRPCDCRTANSSDEFSPSDVECHLAHPQCGEEYHALTGKSVTNFTVSARCFCCGCVRQKVALSGHASITVESLH
jgi:hypothetical protein